MTLWIAPPHTAVILTIPPMNLGNFNWLWFRLYQQKRKRGHFHQQQGFFWLDGCIDAFVIDKLKTESKSKIKEHKLSSNNLDKALHDAHILNTLRKPTNKKYKQTKSNKNWKFSISVQLSLSNWSFQQARKTYSPRLDW